MATTLNSTRLGLLALLTVLVGPAFGAPPPLLDRSMFLAEPEITSPQISPDGRFLAFLRTDGSNQSLWVKRTDRPLAEARRVNAARGRAPHALYWSKDSRHLLFSEGVDGQGKADLFTVSLDATARTLEARNLTRGQGSPAEVLALPEGAAGLVYVGLSDAGRSEQDVYAIEIATGKRTLVRKNNVGAVGWVFDAAGKPRLAIRNGQYGQFELVRLEGDAAVQIYSCSWSETCNVLGLDPGGDRAYVSSNRGDAADLVRLVSVDLRDGHEQLIAADPAGEADLKDTVFSPLTHRPAATIYEGDIGPRHVWRDRAMEAEFRRLRALLPGMALRLQPAGDGKTWLVLANSDREPGEAYLFDGRTGRLTLQYRVMPMLARDDLAPMKIIHYHSADGLGIRAYLTLPRGVAPRTLPMVVLPHEGPWNVRDQWAYSGVVQFLTNRGFAVLQPNFRGSLGYGKRFLKAGDRQWGEQMQDDISAGVRSVVASGIADPKRVVIFGMSYGGYAALAGAAFTPELYAAAIDMSGPSDLSLIMDSPVAKSSRVLFVQSVGDPSTPEGKARLERQSPISAADRIKAPLLMIQGAQDPASVQAQSDRMVEALRRRHAPVTYLLAEDEAHVLGPGHVWAHSLNNQAVLAAIERFLAWAVGTRYQHEMPPEVARRLQELTVPSS